jgi:type VI secretion system protein ImpE
MDATELFRAGRLDEALEAQLQEVKAHPADQSKRLFLFELAVFAGDLDRARRQLELLKYDQPELETAATSYKKLIESEQARRRCFTEGLPPRLLGDPPEHVRLRVAAVLRLRENRPEEAAELLEKANADARPVSGALNDKPFELLRDADDLFANIIEVMAHGLYFWVALEQVVHLSSNPPRFPRDLLYLPARLELAGEVGDVFLPALYPMSHEHPDPQVKLGRATDWLAPEKGPILGRGLHTYLVDEDMIGLLEWRELKANEPEETAASEGA